MTYIAPMTLENFNVYLVDRLKPMRTNDPKPFIVIDKDGSADVYANGLEQAIDMVAEVNANGGEITEVNYLNRWTA